MSTLIPLVLVGAYVGWNIGANDAGNCIGTSVGSGLLSFRRAIILVSVFAIAGGVLQGGHVMKTIGKGIVTSELPFLAVLTALLCAGIFVTIATLLKLPVSTSEAIVGGVLGVGLAAGADLNPSTILSIGKVWVICPILVGALAALIYVITRLLLRTLGGEPLLATSPTGDVASERCIHLVLSRSKPCGHCDGANRQSWIPNRLARIAWGRLTGGGSDRIWSPYH